jgi:hypothetical protein
MQEIKDIVGYIYFIRLDQGDQDNHHSVSLAQD